VTTDAPWLASVRPSLGPLSVYDVPRVPARARMHANENPEPWPEHVMAALGDVVRTLELGRYPDTSGRELREVLATRHACDARRIVLGNGSDEVISLLLTALGGGARPVVVTPVPTFVMYAHAARVLGYEVREVELDDALQLDEEGLDRALVGATLAFFARPNNPTGTLWNAASIERLALAHPSVVFVVDEAYIAYAPGQSLWGRIAGDNVVFMNTLSKVGLAALRIGYAIADPRLALALDKVRHPYNISQTSIAIAHTVLTRFASEQQDMVARAIACRERLAGILASIPGSEVFDSAANLVVVRLSPATRAAALVDVLARAGILVKDVGRLPRLSGCIRASVGTAAELDHVETTIATWIAGGGGT
jgi:histidinol-phosphate aminotransferase